VTDIIGSEFTILEYRRALEALRNGVPNRHAVRVLGCGQSEVEERFRQQLRSCRDLVPTNEQAEGTLVAGGFGTGKSHLLEYLQHVAITSNFVCSRIVISKETPLYDLGKVFLAAIENAVLPRRRGQAVKEMAVNMMKSPSYADFYRWANDPANGISALFPATLLLHERLNNDPELVEDITDFWSGERLAVAQVRQGLRQCGAAAAFTIKTVPVRQLANERFAFMARMIMGAGYAGWVLLIDEVELIGRYSLLQRGRSYAELARWMGRIEDGGYPGLTAVAAITDDFDISVLKEKGDSEYIGPRLRDKGTEEMAVQAARAETGMRIIERQALHLEPPNEETLSRTYAVLRQVHGAAHEWEPPDVEGGGIATRRAMRSYLRRWINEWDLMRTHPDADLHTEEEEVRPTYGEDDALEVPGAEESADPRLADTE
jgi:hypothetical protein